MAIVSSKSFEMSTPQTRAKKGKLVRVEMQPGRFVKMYEADAVAAGLIEAKAKPAAGNKMVRPEGNKTLAAEQGSPSTTLRTGRGAEEKEKVVDDFTTINGIGPASARALQARGITSFEALRQATALDYLTPQARQAIEQWKGADTDGAD